MTFDKKKADKTYDIHTSGYIYKHNANIPLVDTNVHGGLRGMWILKTAPWFIFWNLYGIWTPGKKFIDALKEYLSTF